MNENAEKWVSALRSGEYKQTDGKLGGEKDGYCCLGVACRVYEIATGIKLPRNMRGNYAYDSRYEAGELDSEFDQVREWLGLQTNVGLYASVNNLANDNDSGIEFEGIAEIIESEPEDLFV